MSLLGAHLNLVLAIVSVILWSIAFGWYFWREIKHAWAKRLEARAKEKMRLAVRRR
jgi:hypothetical protein